MSSSCAAASVDVAIVGAGISGLACAAALASSSRHTTVAILDARTRVGGRLLSTARGSLDLGASWAWPPHERRAATMAAKLGVNLLPQRLDGGAFAFHQGKMRNVGNAGAQMAPCGGDAMRFQGGYAKLATATADALPSGALRLGSTVTSVESIEPPNASDKEDDGRLLKVTYTSTDESENNATTKSNELTARRVVLALPPGVLASSIRLSPSLPAEQHAKQAATLTWCGDWAKVSARFRSPFWRTGGHSGVVATPGAIQIWWEGGGGEEAGDEAYALVGLGVGDATRSLARFESGSDDAPPNDAIVDGGDPALRAYVVEALAPAFGEATVAAELESVDVKSWIADPLTYSAGGSHRDYGHPLLRRPTSWGLHFAGTETEDANGHVEGAIAAGERAAAEVTAALGATQ